MQVMRKNPIYKFIFFDSLGRNLGKRIANLKSIGQVFLFLHSIAKSILSVDNP